MIQVNIAFYVEKEKEIVLFVTNEYVRAEVFS